MLRPVLSGSIPSRQHLPEREGRLTEKEVLQHIIYITHLEFSIIRMLIFMKLKIYVEKYFAKILYNA